MKDIKEIFSGISEYHDEPIRGSKFWESNVYYRVEDLSAEEIETCAGYLAERIINVCSPNLPKIIINIKGSYLGLSSVIAEKLRQIEDIEPEVVKYEQIVNGSYNGKSLKNVEAILVNDVITTAKSCLEAHSKVTMMGAYIYCWAALIDRTFGPGPVPIVAAFTGEPVTLTNTNFL